MTHVAFRPAGPARRRRGLTLLECATTLAATALAVSMALPMLGRLGGSSAADQSASNLVQLGLAHAIYAADWDGRQLTHVVDDISTYGNSTASAFPAYRNAHGGGFDDAHPPVVLGWGELDGNVVQFAYYCWANTANCALTLPISFTSPVQYFGSFRLVNARAFHDYVGGRFYDPLFYAPADDVVMDEVEEYFDSPWEYVPRPPTSGIGDIPAWMSYVMSPAAMFHPDVFRHPSDGGWQDPWLLDHGFQSPGLWQAKYASLKTFMLEHHWLQDRPADPCNPAFEPGSFDGCEPWYFNHGYASSPVTLFYDLSVRQLPNTEAIAADEQAIKQTGFGLWSRDTPFGADGYLQQYGYDSAATSHHILTTDGIGGRDTTEGGLGAGR